MVKRKVTNYYRDLFEQRKEQLLGANSAFTKRRVEIQLALQDAIQAKEYWLHQIRQLGKNDDRLEMLGEAKKLEQLFRDTLKTLDRQSQKILEVLAAAQARLQRSDAALEELAQRERIHRLRSRAEIILPQAQQLLMDTTEGLINELHLLAGVLSGVDRTGLMEYARSESAQLQPLYEYAQVVGDREAETEEIARVLVRELEDVVV